MPNIDFNIVRSSVNFSIERKDLVFNLAPVPIVFNTGPTNIEFSINPQRVDFNITGGIIKYVTETIVQEGDVAFARLIDQVDDQYIYIGEANPGSATSAPAWRIKRVQFVTSGGFTDIFVRWADGTSDLVKIWDNRATYTYL